MVVCGAIAVIAVALTGGCVATDQPRPARWSYLSAAIFEPSCAATSCHSRAVAAGGIDFSTAARGYTSLTSLWVWIVDPNGTVQQGCRNTGGTMVCQREQRSLVIPFNPAQSRLTLMLRARGAPRMPPDEPLPEADIRLIEQWILDGALDDTAPGGGPGDDDAGATPVTTPITAGPDDASAT